MIRNLSIERQLADILTDCGWQVFECDDDAITYGLENATDNDLRFNDLIKANDVDELIDALEGSGYSVFHRDDVMILDKSMEKNLTDMYNEYILKGTINKDLLSQFFEETIQRYI